MNSSKKIPVAIVGANGYTGLELARLLLRHPQAQLEGCFVRNSQWKLGLELLDSGAAQVPTFKIETLKERITQLKTVFLATPPEVSMELAPMMVQAGVQVIDLSGAFRLAPATFERSYHLTHLATAWVEQAQYGLVPWSKKNDGFFISNPGCYATSILMALIPLLKDRVIDPLFLVIDSKSGTSGAGLKAKESLLFTEVDGDCLPYRVGAHQHLPEMITHVKAFADSEINPHFSTSLLPTRRGIISAIYSQPDPRLAKRTSEDVLDLIEASFQQAYREYPLVRHGRLGQSESQDKMILSLRKVVGSCRTHISYTLKNDKIYIFSTLDNLLKGAASQAVENWNVSLGLPVETGLTTSEGQL